MTLFYHSLEFKILLFENFANTHKCVGKIDIFFNFRILRRILNENSYGKAKVCLFYECPTIKLLVIFQ